MSKKETWGLWSWAERQSQWMEVGRGTEKDMTAALERRREAARKHLPSARFCATPLSEPPDWVPEDPRPVLAGDLQPGDPGYLPGPGEKGFLPALPQELSDAIADAIIYELGKAGQSAVVTVQAAQVDPASDADGAAIVSVIWSARPPEKLPRSPIGTSDTGTKGYGGVELAPGPGFETGEPFRSAAQADWDDSRDG